MKDVVAALHTTLREKLRFSHSCRLAIDSTLRPVVQRNLAEYPIDSGSEFYLCSPEVGMFRAARNGIIIRNTTTCTSIGEPVLHGVTQASCAGKTCKHGEVVST